MDINVIGLNPKKRKLGYFEHIFTSGIECRQYQYVLISKLTTDCENKKHLKNVGPIHHCEPPHANSPDVAIGTVACRLRIDVHNANDNTWQRGPLWPHGMGPIMTLHDNINFFGLVRFVFVTCSLLLIAVCCKFYKFYVYVIGSTWLVKSASARMVYRRRLSARFPAYSNMYQWPRGKCCCIVLFVCICHWFILSTRTASIVI